MVRLYIARHGKAENTSPDFERCLSSAGQEGVTVNAKYLKDENIQVDLLIYSPAYRAKQTAMILCNELNITPDQQHQDARIYNASLETL